MVPYLTSISKNAIILINQKEAFSASSDHTAINEFKKQIGLFEENPNHPSFY